MDSGFEFLNKLEEAKHRDSKHFFLQMKMKNTSEVQEKISKRFPSHQIRTSVNLNGINISTIVEKIQLNSLMPS